MRVDLHSPFDNSVIASLPCAGPMDFVQALAPAKKALEESAKASSEIRARWLTAIADELHVRETEFARREALFEGLPASFVLEKSIRAAEKTFRMLAAELKTASDANRASTGLMTILVQGGLATRVIAERLAPAIAAGNAIFLAVPASSASAFSIWTEVSASLPPGLVNVLFATDETHTMMASHPSVRAVSFSGRPEVAAKFAAAAAPSFKKLQISGGAKNGLLIHPEADLSKFSEMMEGVLVGAGRLPWSLTRIFATESHVNEITERIQAMWSRIEPLTAVDGDSRWTPSPRATLANLEAARATLVSDHAKVVAGGDGVGEFHVRPLVVRDLTNCSALQLEDVAAPLVILNSVKYVHEMAKWTNTGDYAFAASLWGPADKAANLAAKLDVGRVWINGWLEGGEAFAGWKKSFFGISDFRWNGGFYSDVRTLTEGRA